MLLLYCSFHRKKGKRLPSAGRSGGGDKSGKGLRHFSMKVCEKVQQKRTTSYNEVSVKNVTIMGSS